MKTQTAFDTSPVAAANAQDNLLLNKAIVDSRLRPRTPANTLEIYDYLLIRDDSDSVSANVLLYDLLQV